MNPSPRSIHLSIRPFDSLLFSQLFANDISTFFAVDLILTAIVFLVFSYSESHRLEMGNWWVYAVVALNVGPSFALPLFLCFREKKVEAGADE